MKHDYFFSLGKNIGELKNSKWAVDVVLILGERTKCRRSSFWTSLVKQVSTRYFFKFDPVSKSRMLIPYFLHSIVCLCGEYVENEWC